MRPTAKSSTPLTSLVSVCLASLVFLSSCVSTDSKNAKAGAASSGDKNEVFVLGSIHNGMLGQPNFGIREFVAALEEFHPDVILTETRVDRPGPIDGSVDGGIEQSIVYAYGNLTNVPVTPVDWLPPDFLDQVRAESAKEPVILKQKVAPLDRVYEKQFRTGTFLELQGPKVQNLIRKIYSTYEKAGSTLSLKRNKKICENVQSNLKLLEGKRVAIVFGLDHKYALEDCAKKAGAKVVAAASFIQEEKLKNFQIPEPLREQSVTNIKTSMRYLQQELERGKYQGAMKKQLEGKLLAYPTWIESVNAL